MAETIYDVDYSWHGWESEPEMSGDGSGDPDTYYLTICHWGEEIATICHRASEKFPIDGPDADYKIAQADRIVAALKAYDDKDA